MQPALGLRSCERGRSPHASKDVQRAERHVWSAEGHVHRACLESSGEYWRSARTCVDGGRDQRGNVISDGAASPRRAPTVNQMASSSLMQNALSQP